jgi:hypothetical protein
MGKAGFRHRRRAAGVAATIALAAITTISLSTPAAAHQPPSPPSVPRSTATATPPPEDGLLAGGPAHLQNTISRLDALPSVPNTAWGLNPDTGTLTLTLAGAAPQADTTRLLSTARRLTPRLQVQHVPGALRPQLEDGEEIENQRAICTAGFNVTINGKPNVITAGHCTAGDPYWTGLGPTADSTFPGHDYGLIRNTESTGPGIVDLHNGNTRTITSAGHPSIGERVCKSGYATGLSCGAVTALDVTVTYADGNTVHGLIATHLHAGAGDSGAPLFAGHTGLGTLSGGNGSTEYFQPLPPALHAYQATLATSSPATTPAPTSTLASSAS